MLEVFFFFSSVCVRERERMKSFPSAFSRGSGGGNEKRYIRYIRVDKKGKVDIYIYRLG